MSPPKQITLRNPSPELARRLRAISEEWGESLNSTILKLLERAVGIDERRKRLEGDATWDDEDLREFEDALGAQRRVDDELWR